MNRWKMKVPHDKIQLIIHHTVYNVNTACAPAHVILVHCVETFILDLVGQSFLMQSEKQPRLHFSAEHLQLGLV